MTQKFLKPPTKEEVTRYLMVEEHVQEFLTELCVMAPAGEHLITFYGADDSHLYFEKSVTGQLELKEERLTAMVSDAVGLLYRDGESALLTLRTFLDRGRSGPSEMRGWAMSYDEVSALAAGVVADRFEVDDETGAILCNDAREVTFCDAWEPTGLITKVELSELYRAS